MRTDSRFRASMLVRAGALALVAAVMGACDGKLVPATTEFERTFEFSFDSDESTSDSGALTASEILGELDIPDGANVTFVDIQRVRLSLAPGAGNDATSATLQFSYQAQDFSEALDIMVSSVEDEPVDALVANALRAVEDDVIAIIRNAPGAPFEVRMDADVSSVLAGGSRLVLDATLDVKITVSFEICEEIGFGPFGPGADCITADNPLFDGR